MGLLLWSDFCQEVNAVSNKLFLDRHICVICQHLEGALILQFPACGHSVIRGLVTDRLMVPPRVLRSKSVDHRNANIAKAQIAQPLQWSQLLTDTDRYSIVLFWQKAAVYCWLLPVCALHQGRLAVRVLAAVHFTLGWQPDLMYLPPEAMLMLAVIIPQIKHASSLATATTATFFFFPWRIIL